MRGACSREICVYNFILGNAFLFVGSFQKRDVLAYSILCGLRCTHFLHNGDTYQRVMLGEIQDLLVGVNTMKKKSVIKAKSALYPAAFVGESSSG